MNTTRILTVTILLGATALTPLAAIAQTGDPEPAYGEIFSPNRIANFFANTAIVSLRTQMELEYEHLSTDIMRGTVSMSGVTIRPQLAYDQARQCEITIDRVVLASDIAQPFEDRSEATLDLIGAEASLACLERDVAVGFRSAGFTRVALDQARIHAGYVLATGETEVNATLAINEFATFDFAGSGILLPRLDEFGFPAEPAVRVTSAVISLRDDGAWESVAGLLPGELRQPENIRAMGSEAVSQLLSNDGTRQLSAIDRNFVTQLMDQVADFVADPGEITIEANLPPGGSEIEAYMFEYPSDLIAALALEVRTAPRARSAILDVSALAGLDDPTSISDDARLALAEALLTGEGAPRAPALVPDLLRSLADGGNAQAASLIARSLQDTDTAAAYPYALAAAAADLDAAVSQLDRLEARMTSAQVLEAQATYLSTSAHPAALTQIDGDDPRALRAVSLAYLTGSGEPRSYARAYYFAMLAEAAGDIAAPALRSEIEGRFSARGPEAAAIWTTTAAVVEAQALNDWVSADLPSVYRR